MSFKLDKNKAINVLLYVLNEFDNLDFHALFKLIYFAERKHLSRYGRPILGDKFIKMDYGPVPSRIYDKFKNLRDNISSDIDFQNCFEVIGDKEVKSKNIPDLDYLSESDIKCLDESIEENKQLNFNDLSDKSHDKAWHKANENDKMSYENIAKAEGASEKMLKYIKNVIENTEDLNKF